jgi:hypothetical protein
MKWMNIDLIIGIILMIIGLLLSEISLWFLLIDFIGVLFGVDGCYMLKSKRKIKKYLEV